MIVSRWAFALAEFFINSARGTLLLALGMYLYKETGGLWALTANVVLEFTVTLALQGFAGAFVDRFGGKRILYFALVTSIVITLLGAFTVSWHLVLTLTAVIQVLNAFKPFIRNSVFTLVSTVAADGNFEKVNAHLSIALQAGQILGMAMAGVLIAFGSVPLTLYFVALMFFCSFMSLVVMFTFMPKQEKGEQKQNNGSWSEAFAFVTGNTKARVILLVASFDFAAIALFNLMLAPVVKLNFDDNPIWLTALDLSFAVGAILAGFLVSKWALMHKHFYSAFSLSGAVLVYLTFAYDLHYAFVLAAIVFFGVFITYSTVFWGSELQRLSPTNIKGRISSLRYISNASCVTLTTLIVSALHNFSFFYAALGSVGVCALMLAIALFFSLRYPLATKPEGQLSAA